MELIDVVMKLVGPVDPVGETHTDDKRLDNLIVLRDLTRELLYRIESVAEASGGHMASVKVAKDCAASFLTDVRTAGVEGGYVETVCTKDADDQKS